MTSLVNKKIFEGLFESMNQKLQNREINSALKIFDVIVEKYQKLSVDERLEITKYYIETIEIIKKSSIKQSNYMSQLMDNVIEKYVKNSDDNVTMLHQ